MIAIQIASICATFNLVVSKINLVKKLYYLWNNQVNSGDAHNTFLESTILNKQLQHLGSGLGNWKSREGETRGEWKQKWERNLHKKLHAQRRLGTLVIVTNRTRD